MNTDLFIYDKMPRTSNFGTNIETNYTFYIHDSLFSHEEWKTYNGGYLITHRGVRDFLVEMAIITNLAYTYRLSGCEVYKISPFYVQSMYKAMDWRTCVDSVSSNYQRTSHILKTSRMMKDYIVMETRGGLKRHPETNKRAYVYSTYRITDKLKELASSLDEGMFSLVNVKQFVDGAERLEKIKTLPKLYVVNTPDGEVEFNGLMVARRWAEENGYSSPIQIQTPNQIVRLSTLRKDSFSTVHNENVVKKPFSAEVNRSVSLSNTVKINRKEIETILSNPSSSSVYSLFVMGELFRLYEETSNDNNKVELKYFESKQGRHYIQGSALQLFPKELRERVLSDYVSVDMECSIFSLYKNLGKKYGYKKATPQIDEVIRDRKAFRERFVSPSLSYDGVKTVLTAIAYGAVVDIYNMYMEASAVGVCRRRSSLLSLGFDKMSIVNMCNTDAIQDLKKELRSLGNFIIKKCTDKERKVIVNLCGNELSLKNKPNFGTKMAHIYQAFEAAMLKELKNARINNIPLGCYEDGIGLFLHDGLYVNKELAKKNDLCNIFSKHIKEVFDFDISYEIE